MKYLDISSAVVRIGTTCFNIKNLLQIVIHGLNIFCKKKILIKIKNWFVVEYVSCEQWRTQEFFRGGGGAFTNTVEDRGQTERGSGGDRRVARGSGGSCNLAQEISFHIVKFS